MHTSFVGGRSSHEERSPTVWRAISWKLA